MSTYFDPISQFGIERYAAAIGLSALWRMSPEQIHERPAIKVALPDNLIKFVALARDGSKEHQEFLNKIVTEFAESDAQMSGVQLTEQLYQTLSLLQLSNSLITISDEDVDEEVGLMLVEGFSDEKYFISMSPRRNFVREYYTKIISWAKGTGGLIIEASSYPFKKIGHYISTLQLPDKFDSIVGAKKKHIERVFSFRGGQSVKWFVAVVSGAVGLFHWYVGVPGLIIAFLDP